MDSLSEETKNGNGRAESFEERLLRLGFKEARDIDAGIAQDPVRAYQRANRLPPDGHKTGLVMNCFPKPYPNPDNEWVSANHYEGDDTSKLPAHPPIFLVVAIDALISDTIEKAIKAMDEREERQRQGGKFRPDPALLKAVRQTLEPVQKSLQ